MHDIFNQYQSVIVFDCETSGLDPKSCQMIELAAVKINIDTKKNIFIEKEMDDFIRLPAGEYLPGKIVELTGINDLMLMAEGIEEKLATEHFLQMVEGDTLLIAHNAQFDAEFLLSMLNRHNKSRDFHYLDTVTVYKDRRAFPHKLENAITEYGLANKVKNSHRAIDDVKALLEVLKCMNQERSDLKTYINIFGYNPKYGVSGAKLPGVTYAPQRFNNGMTLTGATLPAQVKRSE